MLCVCVGGGCEFSALPEKRFLLNESNCRADDRSPSRGQRRHRLAMRRQIARHLCYARCAAGARQSAPPLHTGKHTWLSRPTRDAVGGGPPTEVGISSARQGGLVEDEMG